VSTLRDALSAGEADTPAGIDLAAVHRRATRLRRRRTALTAGAVAVLAAVAVTVPVLALRPDPAVTADPVPPPVTALACPDQVPAKAPAGGTGRLVEDTPTGGLACGYLRPEGRLGAALTLTAAEARDVVA
jgi:hypothetical protein